MIESFGENGLWTSKASEGRILSEWSLDLQKLFGSWFWYILIPFTSFDFPLRIGFEGASNAIPLNFGPTGLKIGFRSTFGPTKDSNLGFRSTFFGPTKSNTKLFPLPQQTAKKVTFQFLFKK
jgi:hypothetical protein